MVLWVRVSGPTVEHVVGRNVHQVRVEGLAGFSEKSRCIHVDPSRPVRVHLVAVDVYPASTVDHHLRAAGSHRFLNVGLHSDVEVYPRKSHHLAFRGGGSDYRST
jgi:hypothetical protein